METRKQKFTIEFEYPAEDARVSTDELRGILYDGLKFFGWDMEVTEEEL